MMTYRRAEGDPGGGGCVVCNYVHLFRGGFSNIRGVCSILFLFHVVSDGGKVIAYIVLCFVQRTTYSCY
jgi:hypothetical protein